MNSRQRISARDYKRGGRRHGQFDIRYPQFLAGLGVGLLVAVGVYFYDHRAKPADEEVAAAAHPATDAPGDAAGSGAEDPTEQYDFYDMLPKFEVVIPEQERNVRRDVPAVPIEQPGAYVIQAGSFQNEAEATRRHQALAKLGIDATVQRIAVDDDVRHRVRIGPTRDLKRLNEMRRQLRAADIEVLLIKLPE